MTQLSGFTFFLFFSLFLPLSRSLRARTYTHAGTPDSLRADLQYSHISLVTPLCPLLSLSLFAGSLALSGVIGARGDRGLPARVLSQLLRGSPGYRCARGQSPGGQLALRREIKRLEPLVHGRNKTHSSVSLCMKLSFPSDQIRFHFAEPRQRPSPCRDEFTSLGKNRVTDLHLRLFDFFHYYGIFFRRK